jgi:predicted nucleic acid-binding protein
MGGGKLKELLMDANVLIDLLKADRALFKLISGHVGRLHVPLPVLREDVKQIAEQDCAELGIVPVEPSLDIVVRAAVRRSGLSFHDHMCLLLARENGWICVTNDGRLRRECSSEHVAVAWGLEVIAGVVDAGGLTAPQAAKMARAIQRANPRFITDKVVSAFLERVGLGRKPRRRR